MQVKSVLKNILVLLMFFIAGMSAGVSSTLYVMDIWPLSDQTTVPDNPAAIVIIPFISLILCTIADMVLAVIIFSMKKNAKLTKLLFNKRDSGICIVLRIIGYILIALILYEFICDRLKFGRFFANGLWFYASMVVLILTGMIIIISLLSKETEKNSEDV